MLISYRWLARHVDLDGISPEQLAEDLTLSTCEVEGLEPFAPHLDSVTVGHVREHAPHPDADKLSLCSVDVGEETPLQIVCGAPNVAAGQKVAVAKVGTVLPGDFKIKRSKIRGVESCGMICSVRELGLGDEHDGIWVLPEDAPVGAPVGETLGITDWVLEVDNKSLTHRPDLWGHRGMAGEVAAIYDRPLKPMDLSLPEVGGGQAFPVRIESAACPRYMGLVIDGVQAETSPDWLRNLLLAVEQRPIDLVVDLSNFVMLDLGQPNHTFDREGLSATGILVREARAGERITTLDGEPRELLSSDLLICSGDEPVALAGIMGGEGSKVELGTASLLLEVACFVPSVVRRTSARLGLRSDSSMRFEKHLDPTLPAKALAHFARTLAALQPGVSFPCQIADEGDWTDPSLELDLRPDRVREALGAAISDDAISDILSRIGFGVEEAAQGFRVSVPSARATKDVTIEQDLIEEVGRIHRYGNVPEACMVADVLPPPPDARRRLVRAVQDRLAGPARMHEVISYSFQSDRLLESVGLAEQPHVQVINPVSEGTSKVRRDVLPSLLGILADARRQREEVALFEVGKGYLPEGADELGQPAEEHQLALALAGPVPPADAPFDRRRLYQLRGVLEDLFQHLSLEPPRWEQAGTAPAWAHPARSLVATARGVEQPLASLSDLEPGVARSLGLEGELTSDVAVGQVSLDALLAAPRRASAYVPLPRYPGVKVDVAVLVPEDMQASEVLAVIEGAGKGVLSEVQLFDLYRGDNLGAGKKSLAYHLLLQSAKKTLTDKECAKFLARLERALQAKGAELRSG